ncbi:hypothetical protein BU26DRAFT_510970 [Trematosphaeria pertusa]|uniref:F-box domain-containing protein n=1 Tax=Trematosphaeria pertusa TaxID=390896 RepID=A0A6A6HWC7_9PLEO|nr:uncharacterized protein BU26DRAFT_510970 [Trematosphaeria pertusa]KAF2242032.1 hypothetical protein BU26DRAFT_510970 [Trematosphaeria pertusa]
MTVGEDLMKLPDEILLDIALRFAGRKRNKYLMNLALVDRRFRAIAREGLVRIGIVTLSGLPQYIELLAQHPHWAGHITRLELGKHDWTTGWLGRWNMARLSAEALAACDDTIDRTWPLGERERLKHDLRSHWDYTGICLCMLIGMLPNVKELSVGTSSFQMQFMMRLLNIRCHLHRRDESAESLGFQHVANLLAEKLHVLKISRESPTGLHETESMFDTQSLSKLKFLSISGESLTPSRIAITSRLVKSTLSPSLEHLRIFYDWKTFSLGWLKQLYNSRECFNGLRVVQLYFRCTFEMFMQYVDVPVFKIEFLYFLEAWSKTAVSFETFFVLPGRPAEVEEPSNFGRHCLFAPLESLLRPRPPTDGYLFGRAAQRSNRTEEQRGLC